LQCGTRVRGKFDTVCGLYKIGELKNFLVGASATRAGGPTGRSVRQEPMYTLMYTPLAPQVENRCVRTDGNLDGSW
jgi:hypothetical protein